MNQHPNEKQTPDRLFLDLGLNRDDWYEIGTLRYTSFTANESRRDRQLEGAVMAGRQATSF